MSIEPGGGAGDFVADKQLLNFLVCFELCSHLTLAAPSAELPGSQLGLASELALVRSPLVWVGS